MTWKMSESGVTEQKESWLLDSPLTAVLVTSLPWASVVSSVRKGRAVSHGHLPESPMANTCLKACQLMSQGSSELSQDTGLRAVGRGLRMVPCRGRGIQSL